MRNLVLTFIAAVAGFMAWLFFQPACAGGAVVRDEAACRAVSGFDAAFCRDVFSRTAKIAAEAGPAYTREAECRDLWPVCEPHGPGGLQWGARPASWCIVRSGATATRIEPQYDRRG
jgi:hypothetical protein